MNIADDAKLIFEYLNRGYAAETTWGEFKTVNYNDWDLLADIEQQMEEKKYAVIDNGTTRVSFA